MRRLLALLFSLDLLAILGFVRPLRLASHYPGETLSLFDIIGHTKSATVHYTLLITAMLSVFLAAYLLAGQISGRRATLLVFGGAGLLALSFLLMYPATNSDLFHYVMESRVLWIHHGNPFTVAPNAYPNDPFYSSVGPDGYQWVNVIWENLPSPYGPAWALLTGIPLLLGRGDPIPTYFAFKLLAIAFYFLAMVAIFFSVRFLRPGREWRAAVLWAWNPLVLMYVAGNGANDVIMMSLALTAVYFGMRARWRAAFPFLALATLVKFVCALLIPVFIVYAVLTTPRQRWRELAESLTLSALIGLLLYAPFWRGKLTFATLRNQASQFTDSPSALLLQMLSKVTTAVRAEIITKSVALILFALVFAIIVRGLWQRRHNSHPDDLAGAAFAVMCAYLMLSVFWFQPWYLLWMISLGAMTVGVRARLTLLFSATGLLTHTATAIAAIKGWYYLDPPMEIAVVVLMVFVPPALYIAATVAWRSPPVRALRRRVRGAHTDGPAYIAARGSSPLTEG